MRVWIELGPQAGWEGNRAIKASHEYFMCHFRFSKKYYDDVFFMWKPLEQMIEYL